jgi:hypothetical protein
MMRVSASLLVVVVCQIIGGMGAWGAGGADCGRFGETDAKKAFGCGDANTDGKLDLDEFTRVFSGLLAKRPPSVSEAGASSSADTTAAADDSKFYPAFLNSLGMIFATEIGDKTFFIAAVMAMSNSRLVVFLGAIGALTVMTVLSTIIGHAVPSLLPIWLTHYASIFLFIFFGGKMLLEARAMYVTGEGTGVSEELAEVEHELAEKGLTKLDNDSRYSMLSNILL